MGTEPPAWRAVMAGARPPPVQPEEFEPSQRGWQHEAASRVQRAHREMQLFPRMSDPAKSFGPTAARALVLICPTCRLTKLDPHLFRVVLLRRLQVPLPPTVRSCRCGRPFESFGHHRAACALAGVLGKKGTLWKAWWHDYVVKQAVVLRPTSWSGNWILLESLQQMEGA